MPRRLSTKKHSSTSNVDLGDGFEMFETPDGKHVWLANMPGEVRKNIEDTRWEMMLTMLKVSMLKLEEIDKKLGRIK